MTNRSVATGVIVFGSARSDGNTGRVVSSLAAMTGFDIIDLNQLEIGYFDYDRANGEDDFMPTIRKILEYEIIVFATPVYWYTMSAVLKTFFDRISDLLKWHKETGRQLRGKSMSVVSTSETPDIEKEFAFPFVRSSAYLGMDFIGHVHFNTTRGEVTPEVTESMREYARQLLSPIAISES